MKFKKTISLTAFTLIFSIIGGAVLTEDIWATDVAAPSADESAVSDGDVHVITPEEKEDLITGFLRKYGSSVSYRVCLDL
ncbi:MAG: hypothetical protein LBB21_05255 [Holosporaceae bacterium]|jgi:hypothetical protein|nr:hypothetical protein [Holosporaceae bacterium]